VNGGLFDSVPGDAPVLVAVVNNPDDLLRARSEGWYRIPFAHAPAQIGADFLAFYQTAAFSPEERWSVRWIAAVQGYRLATRRQLIPEESNHPRADASYYRISLGELIALPHAVPSLRLRRVSFIRTTIERLLEAQEINDLWLHTPAQERLWQALQQAGLAEEVEHEYPLVDDLPYAADFAILTESAQIALMLERDTRGEDGRTREGKSLEYLLARGGWRGIHLDANDETSIAACIKVLKEAGIVGAH
jgi:hypothetical protein